MSLLKKCNPKATWLSVLLAALKAIVVGFLLFWFFFKPEWREEWPVSLPPWLLLCACVFAIFEWQVPADEDDDEFDNSATQTGEKIPPA